MPLVLILTEIETVELVENCILFVSIEIFDDNNATGDNNDLDGVDLNDEDNCIIDHCDSGNDNNDDLDVIDCVDDNNSTDDDKYIDCGDLNDDNNCNVDKCDIGRDDFIDFAEGVGEYDNVGWAFDTNLEVEVSGIVADTFKCDGKVDGVGEFDNVIWTSVNDCEAANCDDKNTRTWDGSIEATVDEVNDDGVT